MKDHNIEEFIITCEGLMISDYEIAIESSIDGNIKDRLKKMKDWFVKICKEFWEKIKALFVKIKDKISRNKKNNTKIPTTKEEYNGVVKAHNILRSENGGKGDLEQMTEVMNEIKNDPKIAMHVPAIQNIVSEMKKNDTSLEEERQKIVKEYNIVSQNLDKGKVNRTIQLITDKLRTIDITLYDIAEDLENTTNTSSRIIDYAVRKSTTLISEVREILNEYKHDADDINISYFKEQLEAAEYSFITDRIKIVDYQLKSVKQIQDRLTRLMDFITMSDELDNLMDDSKTKISPANRIAGLNKLMTCTISYQSLLLAILHF